MPSQQTNQLRALLDENHVEHEDASYKLNTPITVWSADNAMFCFVEALNKTDLHIENATLEQIMTATLAHNTCTIEWRDESHDTDAGYECDGAYFCTHCRTDLSHSLQIAWDDYQADMQNQEMPFNYCPNCGTKINVTHPTKVVKKTNDAQNDRINKLESLLSEFFDEIHGCKWCHDCSFCERDICKFEQRMNELGIKLTR